MQLETHSNHVSANWILDLAHAVRIGEIAGVARILKVIEQLRGVHLFHCN
jgi:hypothetical protein